MRHCVDCYRPLEPGSPQYMRLCRSCYIAAKKREHERVWRLENENISLRAQLASQRRSAPALDAPEPAVLRWLLQRAHPDMNSSSKIAHTATQWLLSMRESA